MKPQSRAWLSGLAARFGGYRHPWKRELDGPDPEEVFDDLLNRLLTTAFKRVEGLCFNPFELSGASTRSGSEWNWR